LERTALSTYTLGSSFRRYRWYTIDLCGV
jgi:hypothetical protein